MKIICDFKLFNTILCVFGLCDFPLVFDKEQIPGDE